MKMPVIIMAGGRGERLGEVTKEIPKPMVAVGGKPYLEHLIKQLISNGFTKFVISAGYKAEVIETHIAKLNETLKLEEPIQVIVEPKRLGSGGGVKYVMVKANLEEALVINGDVFIEGDLSALVKVHKQGNDITMGITKVDNVGQFGEVFTEGDRVVTIKEKTGRTGSGWINAGVYVVNKQLLEQETNELFEFWELIQKTLGDKQKKVGFVKYTGRFIDIGTPEKLAEIRSYLQAVSK